MSKFNQGVEFRAEGSFNIPSGYNDNKIVLMVRDPWTIYSYWEISKEVKDSALEIIRREGLSPSKIVFRLYDLTEREMGLGHKVIRDFELKKWVDDWYIDIKGKTKSLMAEVGIFCDDDNFFCLARSNTVTTPGVCAQEACGEIGCSSFGPGEKKA